MELITLGSPEYKLVLKEYNKIIFNITRDSSYNKFIGGLPITLEKRNLYTLMNKDIYNNYNYSITPKADGTRFLLFTSYIEYNKRVIIFIDRNNNFYRLKDKFHNVLPNVDIQNILIDGELICYDDKNKQIPLSNNLFNHTSFTFLCFDILYGPNSIDIEGVPTNRNIKIGNSVSMCGPVGGKMWPYSRRYNILFNLLYPNENNLYNPLLLSKFYDIKWFMPEIKPIFFMNVLNNTKSIYNNKDGLIQDLLKKFRITLYEKINIIRAKEKYSKIDIKNFKLDGLIFTPFNTEYIIGGAWKKFMNIQYKWKPLDEQTIDFEINKFNDDLYVFKYSPVKIEENNNYLRFKDKLISNAKFEFKINKDNNKLLIVKELSPDHSITELTEAQKIVDNKLDKSLYLLITWNEKNNIILNAYKNDSYYSLNIKEKIPFYIDKAKNIAKKSKDYINKLKELKINYKSLPSTYIGEFLYNKEKNEFNLINLRLDKKEPNSLNTANNVFESIKNPVNINDIKLFFNLLNADKITLKKIMQYFTVKQLARLASVCGYNNNIIKLFEPKLNNKLIDNINLFKLHDNYEFEIRLGYKELHRFQTNLPITLYQHLNELLVKNNIPFENNIYKDYLYNNYRNRYLYINDLKRYVLLSSIEKNLIQNITVDLKYLFNLDLRFSLSDEKQINILDNPNLNIEKYEGVKILEKKRTTYKLGMFNIDCTEINDLSNKLSNTYYNIEFELVDKFKSSENIMNNISKLLLNILNAINS